MPEIDAPHDKAAISQLQLFFAKVAIITAAVLVVIFYATSSFQTFIEKQGEFLKGGPVFWEAVEQKLDKLADAPDMPPEKKQRILATLSKISNRYRPYFDALAGQRPKE
jgi:hypothetical protein